MGAVHPADTPDRFEQDFHRAQKLRTESDNTIWMLRMHAQEAIKSAEATIARSREQLRLLELMENEPSRRDVHEALKRTLRIGGPGL